MRRVSVKLVLQSTFLLLAIGLVALLGEGVRSSWYRLQDAKLIVDVTRVSTRLLTTFQNVRLDRGNTYRQLISDQLGVTPLTESLRAASTAAFDQVLAALDTTALGERLPSTRSAKSRYAHLRDLQTATADA
jgi:hypothetical protein